MAAEIDPQAEHVSRSRDSRAKSCTLTLVEQERACVSSRVSPIARINGEKRRFATVHKRGLSEPTTTLRWCVMIESFGQLSSETEPTRLRAIAEESK